MHCTQRVYSFVLFVLHQIVKTELDVKRPTMDKLCAMSQDLLCSVKNKEVASKLEARLDTLIQRWDRLIQSLDLISAQVQRAAACISMLYVQHLSPLLGSKYFFYNAFTQWRALTVNIQVVYIKILPHLLMESVIKYLFLKKNFKPCNCVKPNRDSRCSGSGDVQWMLKKK